MSKQDELDAIFEKLAAGYSKLNVTQQEFAIKEIGRVRGDIATLLADYSEKDGTIKKNRLNRLLRELDGIEKNIRDYGTSAMDEIIRESSKWATAGINAGMVSAIGVQAVAKAQIEKLNKDVFEYVVRRFGDDGLVLSDRIWRFSGDIRDELSKTLRADIIRGESVNTMIANVRKVHDNETWKIRRLVVTEGNTAYRTATAYNADRSDVVNALRVHRGKANRPDHKCTVLELADKHGIGTGLYYPTDSEIYQMHINCTGFLTYEINPKYL